MDEPQTNATEELDVKVDAVEPLPANGTIVIDISNEDDVNIDTIPPVGVSTIVTNTIVTVTNNLVEISEEVEHHPLIQKDLAPKPLLATVKIKEQSPDSDEESSGRGGSADDSASDEE